MARGRAHSEEVRAQVMAAMMAGQNVAEVAARYSISERTVQEWRKTMFAEFCAVKKQRVGTLLLDYLTSNLECLGKQLIVASDAKYLRQQPASELAVLHGVIADKGFKILEALERNADAEEDGDA